MRFGEYYRRNLVHIKRSLALLKKKSILTTFKALAALMRLIPKRRKGIVLELLLQSIAEEFAKEKQGYLQYGITPMGQNHAKLSSANFPNTAIVISGKFVEEHNFTENTLALLRNNYPEVLIIYSGWPELNKYDSILRKYRIDKVINQAPLKDTPFNVHHQAVSVNAGLREAQNQKIEYAIRLRSDQRFTNPSTLEYLHAMHAIFPIKNHDTGLRGRMLGISDCLSLFAIGHFPDHFHFGFTQDLLKYWQDPVEDNYDWNINLESMANFLDSNQYTEQVLGRNFLERIELKNLETITAYWKHLADAWIIIDRNQINLFWMKYKWWHLERADQFDRLIHYPYNKKIHTTSNIHHEEWLAMVSGSFKARPFDLNRIREMTTSSVLFED